MSSDFASLLKTQLMFSLANRGFNKNAIAQFVAIHGIDQAAKHIPLLINLVTRYWEKRRNEAKLLPESDTVKSSIVIEKYYPKGSQNFADQPVNQKINRVVESIIHLITTIDEVKSLLFNGTQLLPNFTEPIPIDKAGDVWFALLVLERDEEEGKLSKIAFRVFSRTKSISFLKNFIYDCEREYNLNIQNKLGEDLYFFDHHVILSKKVTRDPRFKVPHLPFLTYNKHIFTTSRNFGNIFFEQKRLLKERLEFFMNNRDWYDKKGIPYTLGFLFYGVPGCGKTSTIKAIANVTGRHIINVNLAEIKTKKQLKHLFYSDDIVCMHHGGVEVRPENTDSYQIPISKRLYVIEDIDASNSVANRFHERDNGNDFDDLSSQFGGVSRGGFGGGLEPIPLDNMSVGGMSNFASVEQIEADEDNIDLQTLLNILDGTLETPDRMIVVTTNCPEKLDNALIRPGRIDMFVEFKKASREVVCEMYEAIYEEEMPKELLPKLPDYTWTPAEINQLLFRNFKDPQGFIKMILEENPEDVFKYSHIAGDKKKEEE